MLKLIRKNRNKFLGIVVGGFCALLMMGFGLSSFFGPRQANAIARVNDVEIPYNNFVRRYEQLRSIYQKQFKDNFQFLERQLNLRQRALDAVVSETLLGQLSTELGLSASTEKIESTIIASPYFAGSFSKSAYQNYLRALGLTGAGLERATRDQLVNEQLIRLFADVSEVTDQELGRLHEEERTEVQLRYISIDPTSITEEIDSSDLGKLREFYEDRAQSYRKPTRVKYSFVAFEPKAFEARVEILDDDLQTLYREKRSTFVEPKQIRLRQILVKIPEKKEEETSAIPFIEDLTPEAESLVSEISEADVAREKAEKIRERLDAGENFSALARETSADLATRGKGGDMGFKTFDKLPLEIRRIAATLEIGDLSQVIKSENGYHIIYVEDFKPQKEKSFAEVKSKLEKELQAQDAPLYAFEEAQARHAEWLAADVPLQNYGAEKSLTVFSTPAAIEAGGEPKGIPRRLTQEATSLSQGAKEVVEIGTTTYLLEVEELVESYIPEFEEVKDTVSDQFLQAQKQQRAKEQAEAILASLTASTSEESEVGTAPLKFASLTEAATHFGQEPKTSELFTKQQPQTSGALASPEIRQIAFTLREKGAVAKKVIEHQGAFYIVELAKRVAPQDAVTSEELSTLRARERERAGPRLLETLLAGLRLDSDVWVDTEALLSDS